MTGQDTLFTDTLELAAAATVNRPGPAPREQETSVLAAAANKVRSGSQRARVLLCLDLRGSKGATDDELAVILGHPAAHVMGTRRKELADLGLVEPVDGVRRPTRLGCLAHAYRLTALGRVVANEVRE